MARPSKPIKRQPSTPAEALGAVIRELRLERKWVQDRLARKLVYSRTHLDNVERAKQSPSLKVLVDIAHALGLRPSQLVRLAEKKLGKA